MKVEKMTKKEIISKILHYDSRFSKYLYTLQDLKKSVLINVYAIVLLDFVSSSISNVFYCNFNNFLKDLR